MKGLSKGAGLALLAIPMTESFVFSEALFKRVLTNYLGLPGGVIEPWTHHCCNGVTRTLTAATLNHLETCPMLGRNSAPHNAVRDCLKHMAEQLGLTDQAIIETPISSSDGTTVNADVLYFDRASGNRVVLEVSIVSMGSDTALAASARGELDAVRARLRERELAKRSHDVAQKILNSEGNNTVFYPIVLTASGGMGGEMVKYLKSAYERAKSTGHWHMATDQPGIAST